MRRLSFLESLSDSLADQKIRELKCSELGRQIAVDLEADADFNQGRGRPSHDFLLRKLHAPAPGDIEAGGLSPIHRFL